jgi:hypothetical protein
METVRFSETLESADQSTRLRNPEEQYHHHHHRRENLKSQIRNDFQVPYSPCFSVHYCKQQKRPEAKELKDTKGNKIVDKTKKRFDQREM